MKQLLNVLQESKVSNGELSLVTSAKPATSENSSDFVAGESLDRYHMRLYIKLWRQSLPPSLHSKTLAHCDKLPSGLIEAGRQWITQRPLKSLYINGVYGSGKTTFAVSLVNDCINYAWRNDGVLHAHYISGWDLDKMLLDKAMNGGETYAIGQLLQYNILYLDDLDKITASDRFCKQFFQLINRRQLAGACTIITSNCAITSLGKSLGEGIVSRVLDSDIWDIWEFPDVDLRQIKSVKF